MGELRSDGGNAGSFFFQSGFLGDREDQDDAKEYRGSHRADVDAALCDRFGKKIAERGAERSCQNKGQPEEPCPENFCKKVLQDYTPAAPFLWKLYRLGGLPRPLDLSPSLALAKFEGGVN